MEIIKQPKDSMNEEEGVREEDDNNEDEGITWGMGMCFISVVPGYIVLLIESQGHWLTNYSGTTIDR